MTYRTFFPLVRQQKAHLTGDSRDRFVPTERVTRSAAMIPTEPEYKTEAEVTRAIALGKRVLPNAYDLAKEWQKYQKEIAPKHFNRKQAKPRPNGSHNFVLMGGNR